MNLFLLLLTACNGAGKARCDQLFNDICALQVECGIHPTLADCDEALRAAFVCQTAEEEALFNACFNAVDAADCVNVFPTECGNLLCPAGGCVETPTVDTSVPCESCTLLTGTMPNTTGDTGTSTLP